MVTVDTPGPRDMLTDLITMFHAANATIDVYYSSALHIEKQIQADKYIHDKPSRVLERDLQPVLEKTLCRGLSAHSINWAELTTEAEFF